MLKKKKKKKKRDLGIYGFKRKPLIALVTLQSGS